MIKRLALATFLLCILGACGNKGPLLMPEAPAETPVAPAAPDAPVPATTAPVTIPEGDRGTPAARR